MYLFLEIVFEEAKKYYDVPVYIAGNYNNQYIIDILVHSSRVEDNRLRIYALELHLLTLYYL